MGGGTSFKVEASTSSSHAATHCQYVNEYTCTDWSEWECDGGTTEPCPGGSSTTDQINSGCSHCGGIYHIWYEEYCDTCGAHISTYGVNPGCCEWSPPATQGPNYMDHKTIDVECEHGHMDSHTITEDCEHGYSSDHDQTDYYDCSSYHPCQNGHSSYRTVDHYYCSTHAYLGTSPTCPGLTIKPSPTTVQLYYGQSQRISPNPTPSNASVSYRSNNTNVATVSSSGTITSKGKGQTTITVTATL